MTTEAPATASCCTTNTEVSSPGNGRENLLADTRCCGATEPAVTQETADDEHQHGYISDKQAYLRRMSRIEGQARGISKMIDDEKYCIDILTQVSALTRALQTVATGLLDDHLTHCVLDAAKLSDEAAIEKIQEATRAINRLIRS
ncbi:hypothetical protein GCM10027033_27140 [Leucobacter ruminantium]|uniref:Metal-sensitive transcriptional regulator n=1 Tax=Leucobacter ruminantium TaxID=1289170 RepID=A0A939M0S4_9MICO|nr:metal-sensitive transcriptional regulator [Leucobacter ruminantium]